MRETLHKKLEKIGRRLVGDRALLTLTWCLALIFGWVFVHASADLWLRLDAIKLYATWTVLLGLVGGTSWLVSSIWRKRYSPEGIAVTMEKTFPHLDNRLINYLQLSSQRRRDPFTDAYVKAGFPDLEKLDLKQLQDLKAQKRSRITLAVLLVLLIAPSLLFGRAWAVSVWRTLNPFTSIESPTLTKIIEVTPGDAAVFQGEGVLLTAKVKGFNGHEVMLDLDTSDGPQQSISLGKIKAPGETTFSYNLQKVTTDVLYRFRAGDSRPTAWHKISTRPPPSFTDIWASVQAPDYMKRPLYWVNLREENFSAPVGSQVQIIAVTNVAMKNIMVLGAVKDVARFKTGDKPNVWMADVTITDGPNILLKGIDSSGFKLEEEIAISSAGDKPPSIEVVSPSGKSSLPPGERPQMEFKVADDIGVSEILLEELPADSASDAKGVVIQSWKPDGVKVFQQIWKATSVPPSGKGISYRLIARDTKPEAPNETISSPIVFDVPSASEMSKKSDELESKALASLETLLNLQKSNLEVCEGYKGKLDKTTSADWLKASKTEEEVRAIMHELLANPLEPLGTLTPIAKKLYRDEMMWAVDALKSLAQGSGESREKSAKEAITLMNKILSQLSCAEQSAQDAQQSRELNKLTALLESLIRDQGANLEKTKVAMKEGGTIDPKVIDTQDSLSENTKTFIKVAKEESSQMSSYDPALAATLTKLGTKAEEMKIADDMIIAAEKLEKNQLSEALPLEERALVNLTALQKMLGDIQLKEEGEKKLELSEALDQAKEKLLKLKDLHEKMKEAMDAVRGQKNQNEKEVDLMEEAYQELLKNTKEVLMEIPTDLHIFTDMNAANDVVEDVYEIYQEVEQMEGKAEKNGEDFKPSEADFAKEDWLLAQMGEAAERLDAPETWLGEKADEKKVTTEAFDLEEMPESGIAMAELATAAEDLISDLLEESEDAADKSDDSATNHAMPLGTAGWEVAEGNIASFAAQGKSGNTTPDHKEQDGRSNVGRQGMSTGETAAGSGTIGEGDKNIEARRTEEATKSGQVDLKGEADTAATGGGKLGTGKADDVGMSGGVERMDSKEAGSSEGMAALAQKADALYAKASMKNVRVDSLKEAAHHIRQSGEAIAKGNIKEMKEFQRLAVGSLKQSKAKLDAGPTGAIETTRSASGLNNLIESSPDVAPPQYRDKVSDYFKALNEAL